MLTLFSIPKPFTGPAATAQQNSLASWQALGDEVEIILVGDDAGVAETASAAGVSHIAEVALGDTGAPRLDDAFARVDAVARYPLRCFTNADVVFLDDLLPVLRRLTAWRDSCLAVGRTCDVALPPDVVARAGWQDDVRRRAARSGVMRGAGAIDWFVFSRELYADLPPFVVGRAGFDNWMIWHARSQELPVVDVTADVLSIHQSHDYGHLRDGKQEAYLGPEARRNVELAGGSRRLYSICDATHRLRGGRVSRNAGAILRSGDLVRRARWKLGLDRTP